MARGSFLVARRAGKYSAAMDTPTNSNVAVASVDGSEALATNTKLANALLTPKMLRIPIANPQGPA
jgi:hypothetical protein